MYFLNIIFILDHLQITQSKWIFKNRVLGLDFTVLGIDTLPIYVKKYKNKAIGLVQINFCLVGIIPTQFVHYYIFISIQVIYYTRNHEQPANGEYQENISFKLHPLVNIRNILTLIYSHSTYLYKGV